MCLVSLRRCDPGAEYVDRTYHSTARFSFRDCVGFVDADWLPPSLLLADGAVSRCKIDGVWQLRLSSTLAIDRGWICACVTPACRRKFSDGTASLSARIFIALLVWMYSAMMQYGRLAAFGS